MTTHDAQTQFHFFFIQRHLTSVKLCEWKGEGAQAWWQSRRWMISCGNLNTSLSNQLPHPFLYVFCPIPTNRMFHVNTAKDLLNRTNRYRKFAIEKQRFEKETEKKDWTLHLSLTNQKPIGPYLFFSNFFLLSSIECKIKKV